MKLQHIILNTGEEALVVNDAVVMTGNAGDDTAKLVESVAENLANACNGGLQRITRPAPSESDWSWEGVVMSLQYRKQSQQGHAT